MEPLLDRLVRLKKKNPRIIQLIGAFMFLMPSLVCLLYTSGYREAVSQRVADLVEKEQLGVVIDQCEIENIPPRQLQDIFAQVTAARENRNKVLNLSLIHI